MSALPDLRHAALVLLLLCCGPFASAHADWQALAALEQSGARVSAAAVDLTDNRSIQQLHADVRLTPASLTKLVVATAALRVWPANTMFETRLLGSAPINGGVIAGDLILEGAGDPSLTGQDLWALATQLKAAGVTNVTGRLRVHPAPFASVACETKDRCEAATASDDAYDAPIASVGVDFGTWCVDIRGRAVGKSAAITGCSVAQLPIAVVGSVATIAASPDAQVWAERRTDADGVDRIHVGGRIVAEDSQRFYRSMSNPALGAGLLLKETLHEIGIEVAGDVVVLDGPPPSGVAEIGTVTGLALKEQLGRMLRFSNNYIADVLTLTMAAKINAVAPTTLADASNVLSKFVVKARRQSKRADVTPPLLRSGSGLTPENQLSAADFVGLLAHEYRDTRNFGSFYGGLVVPRQSPFIFLRNGSSRWQDRVALKTGTMGDPHSVCGIAGYLRKKDGGWIAFAAIVNGGATTQKHIPLYEALAAIRADVEQLLARY